MLRKCLTAGALALVLSGCASTGSGVVGAIQGAQNAVTKATNDLTSTGPTLISTAAQIGAALVDALGQAAALAGTAVAGFGGL